jgi:hypothetical protein
MKKAWQTIKGYIWWTHPRGSFHYDVMVTLILLFIFVTPFYVNYADRPAARQPRPRSVLVMPDGEHGLIFRVDARDVSGQSPGEKQAELLRVIEPIAGNVKIDHWAPDLDTQGNVVAYRVWVRR